MKWWQIGLLHAAAVITTALVFCVPAKAVTVSDCSFTDPAAQRFLIWNNTLGDCDIAGTTTAFILSGSTLQMQAADAAGDTTTFPLLAGTATGAILPLTDNLLSFNSSTNSLGIGTGTPLDALHISVGSIRLDDTTNVNQFGAINKGANRFLHNFNYGNNGTVTTNGSNTFLGVNSGNYTMGATATSADQSSYNTGVGVDALLANTTGSLNTGVGGNALSSNTTGIWNVGVGVNALSANTTGGSNVGIGVNALTSNTTANSNLALGAFALIFNTTGDSNSAIGSSALFSNTTGNFSVGIGASALSNNTVSTQNTAIGSSAGNGAASYTNSGGVYIGYRSGFNLGTSSDNNTFVGLQSGFGVTTGTRNVLIGDSTVAASTGQVTTGSGNIAIGDDVAVASATASDQLVIGNYIYGTGLSGSGATISSGKIGIGVTAPATALDVAGTTTSQKLNVSDATAPEMTMSDPGLAHGMTGLLPADSFFQVKQQTDNDGGARLFGASDAVGQNGMLIVGAIGNTNPTDTVPALTIAGRKQSGTTTSNVGSLETAIQLAGDSSTVYMTVRGSGNVGIGTVTPGFQLTTTGTVAMTGLTAASGTPNSVCMNTSTKEVVENAALTCTVSDQRVKQKIFPLKFSREKFSALLEKIHPTEFEMKDNPGRRRWGFVAQDVIAANKYLGDGFGPNYTDDGSLTIDQNALLAVA
ncbi:MAG: tail fiber domain-containing protein, partial [Burkholderiales bacterium]